MDFFMYILHVLSLITIVTGFQVKNCTLACYCNRVNNTQSLKVDCKTGFWKRIPDVPKHTTQLRLERSAIVVLHRPPKCVNYEMLDILYINRNKITAITNDAFECFHNLTELHMGRNELRMMKPSALIYLQSLQYLAVDHNKFSNSIINTLCQLKDIKSIDLSHNKLLLNEGTLECMAGLKKLSSINFSYNLINGSYRNVMWPLRNVSTLQTRYCGIKNLSEETFFGFNVKSINLMENNIKRIRGNTFSNLTNLSQLNIGRNTLQGSHKWILALKGIVILDISVIGLSHVDPLHLAGLFNDLTRLEEVNLSGNNINEKHLLNFLPSLADAAVQQMHLGSNQIKSLDKSIFDAYYPNALRKLILESSRIEYIGSETFVRLNNLTELDLSRNKITNLEKNTFKGLHSLTSLNLEVNHLHDFKGEHNGIQDSPLQYLNLANNDIRSAEKAFKGLNHLKFFNLNRNSLRSIRTNLFRNMPSLSSLYMSENRIQYISDSAFSNLKNLIDLDLSRNSFLTLEGVNPRNFRYLTKLSTLDLTGTLVGRPESPDSANVQLQTLWINIPYLTEMKLTDCKIIKLFPGMFSSLRYLRGLSLGTNYISFIEPAAFKNTSELELLYLDNNRINSVSWMSFLYLPNLRILSLTGNHLTCTCDILWIVGTIKSQQIYIYKQDELYCTVPGQHIQMKLNINVLDCEEPWVAMLKPIATSLACVGVIVIMYLVRHYQWHIRYTFFLAKAGIHRYRELKDEDQYKYDAFVAYHSDDLSWVEHQFLHNVDREYLNDKGYSLCIHHRDWLGGEYIVDNIRKSIVESRKTVIILSKAFATSHWCRFELEMARANVDAGGRADSRIVVILLESIPEELLNPHLIHILTTKTYISWPKDPALHPRFWKAVRKTLKKQLLYRK